MRTIAEFTSAAIGVPFLDGGRSLSGWDCWGLVYVAFREVAGIELPQYGEISARDLIRSSRAIVAGAGGQEWKQVQNPAPMDVVVMRYAMSIKVGHVGLVISESEVLHVESACSTVREPLGLSGVGGRIWKIMRHEAVCQ